MLSRVVFDVKALVFAAAAALLSACTVYTEPRPVAYAPVYAPPVDYYPPPPVVYAPPPVYPRRVGFARPIVVARGTYVRAAPRVFVTPRRGVVVARGHLAYGRPRAWVRRW